MQGPLPYRSIDHPMGLPTLSKKMKQRVAVDNALVNLVAELCHVFHKRKLPWCMELPANTDPTIYVSQLSMWRTQELLELDDVRVMEYDKCMFGSEAKAPMVSAGNFTEMQQWKRSCSHPYHGESLAGRDMKGKFRSRLGRVGPSELREVQALGLMQAVSRLGPLVQLIAPFTEPPPE